MRRLTLFISVALALLVFAIPATASAKRSHHKTRHSLRDRNHNGIPDRWEKKFRVHAASGDPDHDGVTNLGEFHNGTNPRDADTDNDGVKDGQDDANDDGVADGQEQAGVIASFDATTGKLMVTLVNGDTQSGTVNSDTEIECDNPTTASTRDGGGDGQESGDDNSGSGSTQSGDDNSGPGSTNSGDDDQGDNNDQGDDDQGEHEGNCGTDALQAGTIVKEAELRLTSGGAVFKDIELGGKAPA
jgi:hypothetical protein